MAKFTSTADLKIKWNGLDIAGAAGATHRIPDAYVEEFLDGPGSRVPGLAWVTQDELSAITPAALDAKVDVAGDTVTGDLVVAALFAKGKPWFDVKAYGAVGDDAADDTAAIQSAINTAATAGGTIFFPPGTYRITSALSVATPLRLMGAGGGRELPASIIRQMTSSAIGISFTSAANHSFIAHLGIRGAATTADTAAHGIDTVKDVHLDTVHIKGFYNGLRLGDGSFYETVMGCHFYDNINAGILLLAGMTNLSIAGGTRFYGGKYGIYGSGGSAGYLLGVRMDSGAIEHFSQYAVYIDGSGVSQLSLSKIWFEVGTAGGLGFLNLGASGAVKGVSIRDCLFWRTGNAGFFHITAANTTSLHVSGSFFGSTTGSSAAPYSLAATVSDVDFAGNHYESGVSGAVNSAVNFRQFLDGEDIHQASVSTGPILGSRVIGDIANRFVALVSGALAWGPGSAARDVVLYRSGTKRLTIDDNAGGPAGLSVNGNIAVPPGSIQLLASTTAIDASIGIALISAAGALTSIAAPTIATGTNGQHLTILNVSANNITLQDQGTLPSSNLRLTGASVVLGARDSIQLVYVSAVADWVQTGNLVTVV